MNFDKVLVPVDGSARADIATQIAINFAQAFGTKLTFLNVVDFSAGKRFGSMDAADEILQAQTDGESAMGRVHRAAKDQGIDYEAKTVQGVPWEVIVKMSKDFDQIILGVTGKGGMANGRIGDTVKHVIENSHCPVLTIKSGSRRIEEILLPVLNENKAAIDVAISTAKRMDGRITVFAVRMEGFDAEGMTSEIASKCRAEGVEAVTDIGEGDPAEVINAQSGMFDLVIMGTMSKEDGKVLHGGVTEDLIMNAACPVTVVREE